MHLVERVARGENSTNNLISDLKKNLMQSQKSGRENKVFENLFFYRRINKFAVKLIFMKNLCLT
jgi:hypothetical protein